MTYNTPTHIFQQVLTDQPRNHPNVTLISAGPGCPTQGFPQCHTYFSRSWLTNPGITPMSHLFQQVLTIQPRDHPNVTLISAGPDCPTQGSPQCHTYFSRSRLPNPGISPMSHLFQQVLTAQPRDLPHVTLISAGPDCPTQGSPPCHTYFSSSWLTNPGISPMSHLFQQVLTVQPRDLPNVTLISAGPDCPTQGSPQCHTYFSRSWLSSPLSPQWCHNQIFSFPFIHKKCYQPGICMFYLLSVTEILRSLRWQQLWQLSLTRW